MEANALHEPVGETASATLLDDEDVGEVGVRGHVGDDAREPDLPTVLVQAEGDGAVDGASHDIARDAGRPVRGREYLVDQIDVEPRAVGADEQGTAASLEDRVVHGSV